MKKKSPPPKPKKLFKGTITASLHAWALAYGCDHSQFQIMLKRANVEFTPGEELTAQKVFEAITFRSEKDEAIARQANAKAEEQEMINAERRKELMDVAKIEKTIWGDLLQPLRLEIEQMPRSLASLANPEQPEVAEKVMFQWVEKVKSNIKEKGK